MVIHKTIHHTIVSLHSGLAKYYYHKIFYNLSFGLITIFIPIYFLMLGFSLIEVIFWLLVVRGVQPLVTLQSSRLATAIGMKKVLLITVLLFAVFFYLLIQISAFPILFIFTALLWGSLKCIYWSQEFTLFIEVAQSKKAGVERGVETMIRNLIWMVAPVAGGVTLVLFGMPALISLSAVLLLISVIPLFSIKEAHFKFKPRKHDHSEKHSVHRTTMIEMLHRGFQYQSLHWFLPLFLYLFGLEIIEVGLAGAVLGIVGVFVPLLLGKLIDIRRNAIVLAGSLFFILGWSLLLLPHNKLILYAAVFIIGIAGSSIWLAMCKRVCTVAKHRDPSFFGTAFELFDNVGAGLAVLILFILLFFTGVQTMVAVLVLVSLLFFAWKLHHMRSK